MKRRHPKYDLTDEELALMYLKADEKFALEYLAGKFEKDERGKITHRFHESGSEEEARSRAALIRLLRGHHQPLSPMIRFRLAALLDPGHQYEERTFTIGNRGAGRPPRHALMIEIAWFIALEIADGRKMESAKQAAKERYAVSMSTIDRAWVDHKDSELIGPVWKAGRTIN
jgi:hypothetical protein